MDIDLIVTNQTDTIVCSLYESEQGLKLWLKIHAATIEIPIKEFDDLIEVLLETYKDIEEYKIGETASP